MISQLTVVIPAYNEREGIEESIAGIQNALEALALEYELIVVDDGSTDGTEAILSSTNGIRLLPSGTNRGYGAAIKRGIDCATYDHVLITDADASYPPACVAALVERIDGYDMIIGSRHLSSIEIPLSWKLAKLLVQSLLFLFVRRWIPDVNSGARIFRRTLAVELAPILSDGFSYTSGMTVAALRSGSRVRFTPIEYLRRKGRSKVRPVSYSWTFVRSVTRALAYHPPAGS
ncbi:MAG: glycosyltransferase family 2 protein [Candidatus Binatia bacterium]